MQSQTYYNYQCNQYNQSIMGDRKLNFGLYLTIYCFIKFMFGLYASCIGPLIPFLSAKRNVPETKFSFLFIASTIGNIIGMALYKWIQRANYKNTSHKILTLCGLSYSIFMIVFVEWENTFAQWISMIIFGAAAYGLGTAPNICLLLISKEKAGNWIPFSFGVFGLGALLSPQIVKLLSTNCLYYYSAFFLVCSALSYYYPDPEQFYKETNLKQKQIVQEVREGSLKLQVQFCIAFFFIGGIETTFMNWIASYSVITGISDKQSATNYVTIFWTMSTLFRFIGSALSITVTKKLNILLTSLLICGLICILLQHFNAFGATSLFGSFGYGISTSSVFPLLLSVSTQYFIKFRPQQIANMLMVAPLSSGPLAALAGGLMSWRVQVLFYWLVVMSGALWVDLVFIFKQMSEESKSTLPNEQQLQNVLINDK